jgi:hypothetical protein
MAVAYHSPSIAGSGSAGGASKPPTRSASFFVARTINTNRASQFHVTPVRHDATVGPWNNGRPDENASTEAEP